jgi:hypothetical protein
MSTENATPLATSEVDRRRALLWFGVAIGSLVLAGGFALLLVVGRAPPLAHLLDASFFKRCLVVHVDLSLVLWFYAFICGLFVLIPSRQPPGALARGAVGLSIGGVLLLMLAAALPDARPILANYVPVLEHPLFLGGLVAIAAGIGLTLLDPRLLPGNEPASRPLLPSAALPLLRGSAVAILLALLTFAASWLRLTPGLAPEARYEALRWGGGHVLQFASVAAMMAVWVMLLSPVLGRPPVTRATAALAAGLLVTPLLAAPLLVLPGTESLWYRVGFTRLMQLGIAPAVLVFLVLCVRALHRHRPARAGLDVRVTGFYASAGLTLLGFVLGACIHGSNTVVPAHYHASIGGVTVALMAVTTPLLSALGLPAPAGRLARLVPWQPLLLGGGQLVFAIGFALAGASGMARKSYGSEQHIRTLAEHVGLGVMGAGGLCAIAGGLAFLFIVGAIVRRHLLQTPAIRNEVNHARR